VVAVCVVGLMIQPGCGESDAVNGKDIGPSDQRAEPVQPPDIHVGDGLVAGNVGAPCDPEQGTAKGCTGEAVCLKFAPSMPATPCDLATGKGCTGVCTLAGCTLEDIATPEIEDDCPEGTVCTRIPVATGEVKTFCLDRCEPAVDKNPCSSKHAGLTCHPASVVLNDHTEVCLYPACEKDSDCGNMDPINPDSICLEKSGMCLSRGDPAGKIGDPCKTSLDCGPHQYCLLEQTDGSGTLFEDGYCTLVGCKYNDKFSDPKMPYWQCPPESKCFFMGSGQFISFCLAVNCDPSQPDDKDGCRDQASPGQYDCIELGKEKVCWIDVKSSGGKMP
jgi:hypothetical protein